MAQNGDPRKPEIATAQKYFAIQTRQAHRSLPARRGGQGCLRYMETPEHENRAPSAIEWAMNPQHAINTYHEVGREVREVIRQGSHCHALQRPS